MKDILSNIKDQYKKYKNMKSKIPTKVGKIIERVFFFILVIGTFIFIPVIFTLLSTLAGSGTIAISAYNGVFYATWAILFVSLLAWIFFKEYKNK